MRHATLFLLALCCATAAAQVYQRTGPDGQVEFSDQPGPGAEPVEVRPAQTVTITPPPASTTRQPARGAGPAAAADQDADGYRELRIVSPAPDEGVRANDGNVTVQLALAPALAGGHTISVTLAGEAGEQTAAARGTAVAFANLDRGRYTATARVLDARGNALIAAEPVGFNVLRAFVRKSPR